MFRRVRAHTAAELSMTLRRGESLLLIIGLPVVLLAFSFVCLLVINGLQAWSRRFA